MLIIIKVCTDYTDLNHFSSRSPASLYKKTFIKIPGINLNGGLGYCTCVCYYWIPLPMIKVSFYTNWGFQFDSSNEVWLMYKNKNLFLNCKETKI